MDRMTSFCRELLASGLVCSPNLLEKRGSSLAQRAPGPSAAVSAAFPEHPG